MKWINIQDKLPEDDEIVLCYSSSHGFFSAYYYQGSVMLPGWIHIDLSNLGKILQNVTHWTQLPETPQAGREVSSS